MRYASTRLPGAFIVATASTCLIAPSNAFAQRNLYERNMVLAEQPEPDGTPVPRTPDGRADLSGVWNKAIHQNSAAKIGATVG
ncbi:MAG: hypothetical protein PVF50_09785, partial [Gammaproteobacteria bacterium]